MLDHLSNWILYVFILKIFPLSISLVRELCISFLLSLSSPILDSEENNQLGFHLFYQKFPYKLSFQL